MSRKEKFINPFNDTGFKRIFGRDENKELLIGFLNALLEGREGFERVTDVTYLNKEQTREREEGRSIIYDVYCTTQNDHRFILEMQLAYQQNFSDRALLYASKTIVEQARKGEPCLKRSMKKSVRMILKDGFLR